MKKKSNMAITVILNGKKEEIKDGIKVSDLLAAKNIRPDVVTVELNESILEKSKYGETLLRQNDKIELVYYMGGGYAF